MDPTRSIESMMKQWVMRNLSQPNHSNNNILLYVESNNTRRRPTPTLHSSKVVHAERSQEQTEWYWVPPGKGTTPLLAKLSPWSSIWKRIGETLYINIIRTQGIQLEVQEERMIVSFVNSGDSNCSRALHTRRGNGETRFPKKRLNLTDHDAQMRGIIHKFIGLSDRRPQHDVKNGNTSLLSSRLHTFCRKTTSSHGWSTGFCKRKLSNNANLLLRLFFEHSKPKLTWDNAQY